MTRVLAIMFTDIKGFTERTATTSRESLRALLDTHEGLLLPVVRRFGGTLVKTIGDALLCTFESPTNAVLCGLMIQETLAAHNAGVPEGERIVVRVAIASGEVECRDGDVFGEAVNVAARIEGITEASEIYFTESVYLAMNKAEVPSSEIGFRRLKGIPEPIKIYRVIRDPNSEGYAELVRRLKEGRFPEADLPSSTGSGARPRGGRGALAGALVTLLAFAVSWAFLAFGGRAGRIRAVDERIAAGEAAAALTLARRLCDEEPGAAELAALERAVAAFVAPKLDEGAFDAAYALLEEQRAAVRGFAGLAVERAIDLACADDARKRGNWVNLRNAYTRLMKRFPADLEIRRRCVRDMGAGADGGPSLLAVDAALEAAALTTGEIEAGLLPTLLEGLRRNGPESETADGIRRLLVARHPGAEAFARDRLFDPEHDLRVNARLTLAEAGRLSRTEEIAHHVFNLTTGETGHARTLEESLAALEAAAADPGWPALRASLALPPVTDCRLLDDGAWISESAAVALLKAFPDTFAPALLGFANASGGYWRRIYAANALRRLGMDAGIDWPTWHERNLDGFDPRFIPAVFFDGVAFFESFPDRERARAILTRLRERIRALHAELEAEAKAAHRAMDSRDKERLTANARVVEEALARIAPR